MEEFLLLLLIVVLLASPVLAIIFLCLFLLQRSRNAGLNKRISDLEKQIRELKDGQAGPLPAPGPVSVKPAAAMQGTIPKPAELSHQPIRQEVPQAPKTPKISSINITFGVGVLLLTIVSAFFISMSWSSFSPSARIGVLAAVLAVVFFLSFLAGKILKLPQTGYAFYCVGSFMVPIIVIGGAAFGIFGETFSLKSDLPLVFIAAAGLFALAGFIGVMIYKSAVQFSITYLGITWMTVYVFIKLLDPGIAVLPALAFLALSSALILLFKKDIRGLKIYSMILTAASQAAVLLLGFTVLLIRSVSDKSPFIDRRYVFAAGSILAAAAVITLFKGTFRSLRFFIPLAAADIVLAVCFAFDSVLEPIVIPVLISIIIMYILLTVMKERTVVLDVSCLILICLFSDLRFIYSPSMNFPWYAAGYILAGILLLAGICKSDYPESVRNVYAGFAAVFSGLAVFQTLLVIFAPGSRMSLMFFGFAFLLMSGIAAAAGRFIKGPRKTPACIISGVSSVIGYIGMVIIFFYDLEDQVKDIHGIIYAFMAVTFSAMMLINFGHFGKDRRKVNIPFIIFSSIAADSVPMIFLAIYNDGNNADLYSEGILAALTGLFFAAVLVSVRLLSKADVSLISVNKKALSAIYSITGSLIFMLAAFVSIDGGAAGMEYSVNIFSTLFVAAALCASVILAEMRVFAFMPAIIFDLALCSYIENMIHTDDLEVCLYLAAGSVFVLLGRLLFRKKAFAGFMSDSLTLSAVFWFFAIIDAGGKWSDFAAGVLITLILASFIGRGGKRMSRIAASLAVFSAAVTLIDQDLIQYPEIIADEISILLFVTALLIVCKAVRPFGEKVMRILLIAGVSLALIAESVIVMDNGNEFKTFIVGGTAIGLFIYSFIKKEKAWFIVAMVTLVSIAVFFGIRFGNSGIWLVYLLAAGVILIGFAMYNEYMKRRSEAAGSPETRRKRFFDEWKW